LTQRRSPVVEVVRGRLDRAQAEELLAFWAARRALPADESQRRLSEVVCLLRVDGELAGACSVYASEVPLIVSDQAVSMMRATFTALESEFDGASGSPIGLCVLVADPAQRRRHPEAVWPDPPLVYAGYLGDGRQVRVAYFTGAEVTQARVVAM
jgi:hypothetical protein